MSGLLFRLGALCVRRKYIVLALWALIVVLVGGGVLHYGARTTNDIRLPGTGTQQASDLLGREFPPQQNGASPLVFHVSHGKLTDPANKAAIVASLHTIAAMPDVHSVLSPFARGMQSFISKDDRTAVAQVLLDLNYGQLTQAKAAQVFAGADAARKAGIQVEVGGGIGSNISVMKTRLSEEIGVGAAIVILAITFGALVAAGMPVLTALVGLVVGLGLVGLLGHVLSVPNVAPTLATMIGLGVGIDYALFIVFRHRDQLHRGMPVEESVALAIATSGSAVVFAGGTVIVALLALLVANVPILGAMGYAAALTVLVAVATAITLLPAVLGLLGTRVDALPLPGRRRSIEAPAGGNVWARWAGAVTRHPWVALIVSLVVLAPLVAPTATLRLGQEDIGVTPTSNTQRRAFDLISAGLGPGANGPLLVAVQFKPPAAASAAYKKDYGRAISLKRRLLAGQKTLKAKASVLKRQGSALSAQKAGLLTQAATLPAGTRALQARATVLQHQKTVLMRREAYLLTQKARLTAEGQALAVKGKALQVQIATVQQQIAASQDPAQIAQLQARLAALAARARRVQARSAALQRRGAALARQGVALTVQGRKLAAAGVTVKAKGVTLQTRAAGLATQGSALKSEARILQRKTARLKRQERRLKAQARDARTLQATITRLLTRAGGQPRATDPRLARLQHALAHTVGVASVSPPTVNKAGTAAVLAVTATTRPADPKTVDLVQRLRASVVPAATQGAGLTVYVGGGTAAYVDLAALISRRLPLVIGTVLALSFVLLMVAFRSLLVPLKAVICNLLAVGASFGVLTAAFQWGWGLRLVGLANPYGTVPIASYVPLLMFAVLFGLSTDYEVFLISQIFQSHAAGQRAREAVRSGVGTSARVITSAAIIMVTVFASFILNGDPVIKQFGVGLSLAIVLDTTIVRLVIVPATMVLLGEWNWYLPRWLRWLPRTDLPETDRPAPEGEPRPDALHALGDSVD